MVGGSGQTRAGAAAVAVVVRAAATGAGGDVVGRSGSAAAASGAEAGASGLPEVKRARRRARIFLKKVSRAMVRARKVTRTTGKRRRVRGVADQKRCDGGVGPRGRREVVWTAAAAGQVVTLLGGASWFVEKQKLSWVLYNDLVVESLGGSERTVVQAIFLVTVIVVVVVGGRGVSRAV